MAPIHRRSASRLSHCRLRAADPSPTRCADSGNEATQQFCAECGSQLFAFSSGRPECIGIRAGGLDDPHWFKPAVDVWVSRAQPWDSLAATTEKISGGRPAHRHV